MISRLRAGDDTAPYFVPPCLQESSEHLEINAARGKGYPSSERKEAASHSFKIGKRSCPFQKDRSNTFNHASNMLRDNHHPDAPGHST
jgi:hypothetical protein